MNEYEQIRRQYKPDKIEWLLIAESPPPGPERGGSRHFYRARPVRADDRLFTNTIWALYQEADGQTEAQLEADKEDWLRRFQADDCYMIEALEESQEHKVTKKERQTRLSEAIPRLVERVEQLAGPDTKIVLIKSNPFDVMSEPLREAGFKVLNEKLVDYPGHFNQRAYREKLRALFQSNGWQK